MKLRILIAAAGAATIAGCAEDVTVPDQAGYDQAVRCAAMLEATGALYATLAEGTADAPTAERAASRSATGAAFRAQAVNLGAPLAQGRNDTERAIANVAGEIQQEQNRREFTDFAVWLGREADRCPPPPTPPVG